MANRDYDTYSCRRPEKFAGIKVHEWETNEQISQFNENAYRMNMQRKHGVLCKELLEGDMFNIPHHEKTFFSSLISKDYSEMDAWCARQYYNDPSVYGVFSLITTCAG